MGRWMHDDSCIRLLVDLPFDQLQLEQALLWRYIDSLGPTLPHLEAQPEAHLEEKEEKKRTKMRYTPEDDMKILGFIFHCIESNGMHPSLSGNLLWREMAYRRVTEHPWQSMRDHYLRYLKLGMKLGRKPRKPYTKRRLFKRPLN